MTTDVIAVIANLALALSFIAALVFGIVQVRVASRDRRERFTLETLRTFRSREFSELMHVVSSGEMPSSGEEMRALPAADQISYVQFAQEMESLGLLVSEGLVDIDLVDKTLGSLVTTTWDKYKTMILDIRVTQPDPFLGEYFQWLAERIDQRMREQPRVPVHESPTPSAGRNSLRPGAA
jgi:hypothetical protein